MKVHFGQIYIEPGIEYPFSHHFQRRLGEEITSLVKPSAIFNSKYGDDWELMFNISAKTQIDDNEICGPTVYKTDKDVEFTIFLPFDNIALSDNVVHVALQFLLKGCCNVLRELDIDPALVDEAMNSTIESICSDPTMFA